MSPSVDVSRLELDKGGFPEHMSGGRHGAFDRDRLRSRLESRASFRHLRGHHGAALPLRRRASVAGGRPLTLAGFTTIKQANDQFVLHNYVTTFALVVIPILLGDLIAYGLGRRYGLGLTERSASASRAHAATGSPACEPGSAATAPSPCSWDDRSRLCDS